jgi:tetratricopeptide (TPR) repeat protein/predicted Ser/Thr protein kinase
LPAEGWQGLCPQCLIRVSLHGSAAPVTETEVEDRKSKVENPVARRFGDYQLLEEIARGGMGVVYKARQVSLNRTVAVKMILAGQLAGPAEVQRFRGEAEAAANLNHPNIVAIHEIGQQGGQHFFSMDYVEGQNLAQFVGQKPLPPREAAKYLKTIAEAIQYAHERGILHRDLKPSNILIDQSGQPRITDFGLAKRMQEDSDLTSSGQVLGSPNFMPPEQALGKRQAATLASDIYSLGAILYFLLTRRPPFAADSLTETLHQVLHTEPVSPRLLNAVVPRDLETICLKCLSKEPERRYASAHGLAEDLGRFLKGEPVQARPVGTAGKAWRWCRRNPKLASLAGGSLALLLALAIGAPIAAFRINQERHTAEAARRNEARLRQEAELEQKKAQQEAFKSQQVAQFLEDMLQGVGPSVARGRDAALLREILVRTTERVGKDLASQPEVEAELRNTIGEVYFALGQFDRAELMHETALHLRSRVLGEDDLATAESLHNLAKALRNQGRLAEAESLERKALGIRTRLLGQEHAEVATALDGLGKVLFQQGRRAEAESAYRQALAMRMKLFASDDLSVAESLDDLASILFVQRKYDESERTSREAVAMSLSCSGTNTPPW